MSVVVPVLDEEQTLPRLFRSLENQSVLPAEVIVVDGGDIAHSNIMDIKPGESIAVENVRIHSLVDGYGYNFRKRRFITPHIDKSENIDD